jgi:hypothetical protein
VELLPWKNFPRDAHFPPDGQMLVLPSLAHGLLPPGEQDARGHGHEEGDMARKNPRKRTKPREPSEPSAPGRPTAGSGENADRRAPTEGEDEREAERFADGRDTERDLTDEDVEEPARHRDPEGGRAIADAPARPDGEDGAAEQPRR